MHPIKRFSAVWMAVAALGALLAGCTTAGDASQPVVPTATLIAATVTSLPPTQAATDTLVVTEAPEVTIEIVPTLTETPEPASGDFSHDPVATELVMIAQRLVADQTGLPTRRIRVVSVQDLTWRDSSLGCPAPDQAVAQVETPGYRIVVAAGDAEYLFHTDVDRVIPCDPANEVLPADALISSDATAEMTTAP
ncbi:MAG: hypothetical protein U0670_01415 [Anaerolineae bacterium]